MERRVDLGGLSWDLWVRFGKNSVERSLRSVGQTWEEFRGVSLGSMGSY